MKPRAWIPLFLALVFAPFFSPAAAYRIQPTKPSLASNLGGNGTSTAASVLIEAAELLSQYGIRPYWPNSPFSEGENVLADQAPDVVAHLITCESQGVS